MSFCPNCGNQNAEGTAFCSNCGTALNAQPAPVAEQPAWEQPAPVAQPAEPAAPATLPTGAKIMSIISMACGIAGLVFSFCYGSGIVLSIAALVLSIMANKQAPMFTNNTMAKVGKITGIIGIVLAVIAFFVCIIIAAIGGAASSYSDPYYYYY